MNTAAFQIGIPLGILPEFCYHLHFPVSIFDKNLTVQRVPTLRGFWDLEKTALREILISGTVGGPLLTKKPKTLVVETVLVIFV